MRASPFVQCSLARGTTRVDTLTPRSEPRVRSAAANVAHRIAALVYGDATKTDLLRKANRIPDESFVPLGTVLVLPESQ